MKLANIEFDIQKAFDIIKLNNLPTVNYSIMHLAKYLNLVDMTTVNESKLGDIGIVVVIGYDPILIYGIRKLQKLLSRGDKLATMKCFCVLDAGMIKGFSK